MSALPPASHPHHEDDPAAPLGPTPSDMSHLNLPLGGGRRRPLPLCSALSEQELKPKVGFNFSF